MFSFIFAFIYSGEIIWDHIYNICKKQKKCDIFP